MERGRVAAGRDWWEEIVWMWVRGWGGRGGRRVVVTQPKIAVSYVCYVELAGRASLSLSLPPSVRLANIRFAFNPHFSNLCDCLPSAAAVFPQRLSAAPHRLRAATLTGLMMTLNLRRPWMELSSVTRALFCHLFSSFFFLSSQPWCVACWLRRWSRSQWPVKWDYTQPHSGLRAELGWGPAFVSVHLETVSSNKSWLAAVTADNFFFIWCAEAESRERQAEA